MILIIDNIKINGIFIFLKSDNADLTSKDNNNDCDRLLSQISNSLNGVTGLTPIRSK